MSVLHPMGLNHCIDGIAYRDEDQYPQEHGDGTFGEEDGQRAEGFKALDEIDLSRFTQNEADDERRHFYADFRCQIAEDPNSSKVQTSNITP